MMEQPNTVHARRAAWDTDGREWRGLKRARERGREGPEKGIIICQDFFNLTVFPSFVILDNSLNTLARYSSSLSKRVTIQQTLLQGNEE